eukprot:Hpha_TRINITY_DN4236_c0_g1::TRINITY_DN4236_c0_g1_i1::g.186781::m.186781
MLRSFVAAEGSRNVRFLDAVLLLQESRGSRQRHVSAERVVGLLQGVRPGELTLKETTQLMSALRGASFSVDYSRALLAQVARLVQGCCDDAVGRDLAQLLKILSKYGTDCGRDVYAALVPLVRRNPQVAASGEGLAVLGGGPQLVLPAHMELVTALMEPLATAEMSDKQLRATLPVIQGAGVACAHNWAALLVPAVPRSVSVSTMIRTMKLARQHANVWPVRELLRCVCQNAVSADALEHLVMRKVLERVPPLENALQALVLSVLERWVRSDPPTCPNKAAAVMGTLALARDSPGARSLLVALTPHLAPELPFADAASVIAGCERQHPSWVTRDIFDLVASRLQPTPVEEVRLADVVKIYSGLAYHRQARQVFAAVLPYASALKEPFSRQSLAEALYSFRWQEFSPEVSRHIHAVVSKADTTLPLTMEQLASALYGLQHQPTHPATEDALYALLRAAPGDGALDSEGVGECLTGLKSQTDSPAVRKMLLRLAECVHAGSRPIDGAALANALYGLRKVGGTAESHALLDALVPRCAANARGMDPQQLSDSVYGLHGFSDVLPVRGVLHVIVPRLPGGRLADHHISKVLFGLQGLTDTPALRSILARVRACVKTRDEIPGRTVTASVQGLLALRWAGVPVDDMLRQLLRKKVVGGTDPITKTVLAQLRSIMGMGEAVGAKTSRRPSSNATEAAVRHVFEKAGMPGVEFNVMHSSGFELDILWGGMLNIELDGVALSYRSEGKRRVNELRAAMLRERYGIAVKRVDTVGKTLFQVLAEVEQVVYQAAGRSELEIDSVCGAAWLRARTLGLRGWVHSFAAVIPR